MVILSVCRLPWPIALSLFSTPAFSTLPSTPLPDICLFWPCTNKAASGSTLASDLSSVTLTNPTHLPFPIASALTCIYQIRNFCSILFFIKNNKMALLMAATVLGSSVFVMFLFVFLCFFCFSIKISLWTAEHSAEHTTTSFTGFWLFGRFTGHCSCLSRSSGQTLQDTQTGEASRCACETTCETLHPSSESSLSTKQNGRTSALRD